MNTPETNVQNQCVRFLDIFVEGALDAPVQMHQYTTSTHLCLFGIELSLANKSLFGIEQSCSLEEQPGGTVLLRRACLALSQVLLTRACLALSSFEATVVATGRRNRLVLASGYSDRPAGTLIRWNRLVLASEYFDQPAGTLIRRNRLVGATEYSASVQKEEIIHSILLPPAPPLLGEGSLGCRGPRNHGHQRACLQQSHLACKTANQPVLYAKGQ
nr:hypothetical protein Iba_chr13cCG6470 [Ipomoea batatas]